MSSRELDKQALNLDNVVAAEAAVTLLTCRDAKKGMVSGPAGEMPRRKVWAVGVTVVASVTLAFAVAVVLVAVVVGLAVSKHCRHPRYSEGHISPSGTNQVSTVFPANKVTPLATSYPLTTSNPRTSQPDDSPWTNIRLPDSVVPSSYALKLNIDLVNFTFSGSCSVLLSTRRARVHFIVLHVNRLRVNRASITLRSNRAGLVNRPWRIHDNHDNQYMVLRFRRTLVPGETYTLTVDKYSGDIHDQLRGLYKSSYQTKSGETRYVFGVTWELWYEV